MNEWMYVCMYVYNHKQAIFGVFIHELYFQAPKFQIEWR